MWVWSHPRFEWHKGDSGNWKRAVGYGTETFVFFLGNAVKVGWAVTQRWEPLPPPPLQFLFLRPKPELYGRVMTGIEGDSIAKSACDRSLSGPGLPLLDA